MCCVVYRRIRQLVLHVSNPRLDDQGSSSVWMTIGNTFPRLRSCLRGLVQQSYTSSVACLTRGSCDGRFFFFFAAPIQQRHKPRCGAPVKSARVTEARNFTVVCGKKGLVKETSGRGGASHWQDWSPCFVVVSARPGGVSGRRTKVTVMVDSGGEVWFMMQILFVTSWGNPGRASNLVHWNWQLTLEIRLDWERWIVWVAPYTLFEMFLARSWDNDLDYPLYLSTHLLITHQIAELT